MEHQLFKSRIKLWEYLAPKCGDNLDFQSTIRLPIFWFATQDGEVVKAGGVKEFAANFNKAFNGNINTHHSYRYRKACVLFFDDESVVADVVEDEDEVVETPEIAVTTDVVEDKSIPKVDWDWVNSLKSNNDDKTRLKRYAKDKFGIDLKVNKKLDIVLENFKEELDNL